MKSINIIPNGVGGPRSCRLTLGSGGAVVACAVAGLGATLVSRDAVSRQLQDGELVEVAVPGTPLRRPWNAVTHGRQPGATALLVRYLLDREGWRRPAKPRPAGAQKPDDEANTHAVRDN